MGLILTVPLIIIANVVRKYFSQNQNSSFVGCLKQQWTETFINVSKYWQKKRLNNYNVNLMEQMDKTGMIPSEEHKKLEEPISFDEFRPGLTDEVSMSGFNFKGDSLILRLVRKSDFKTEVFLYLHLNGKGSFQLPFLPDSRAFSSDANEFSSCGLKIKCLSPLRKWRISYNGFLKKMNTDKTQEEMIHVKFSFLWLSISISHDFQTDFNSSLLSESMCQNFSLFPYSNLNKFKNIFNNYEQWGNYIGTISIDNNEEEMHLWGPRLRNRGVLEWNQIGDYVKIYGYFKDGTMFNLGKLNSPGTFTNLKYGYVIRPNRFKHPIESCYFGITSKGENNIQRKLIFRAAGKCYLVDCKQLSENSEVFYGGNGEIKSCIRLANYTLEETEGKGYIEFGVRNETEMPQPLSHIYPCLLRENDLVKLDQEIPFVVDINEKICRDDRISGGKGSSLAMLCKLLSIQKGALHSNIKDKFLVPKGIVITTTAYKHHIKSHNLSSKIASLYNCRNPKKLEEICKELTDEFSKTTLSENIKQAIKYKLEELFSEEFQNVPFAVRSSASGEDSLETSAAGQWIHILASVPLIRQMGQILDSNMAVVVQEMVPAQIAGVAFTCDPVTGNPACITITANYGLGESVVSASSEPDTVILERNFDNTLFIKSQTIGEKRIKIQMSGGGGTITENVTEEQAKLCCLQPEDSLRIGHVSILIEQCFGNPRDIEWAIVNNQIYLLQARPITTQDLETEFEITHELDSGHLTDNEYITKANVGEVMPNALSPLSISTVIKSLDLGFQAEMFKEKFSYNVYIPESNYALPTNFNHCFISIIDVVMRKCSDEASEDSFGLELSLFGRIVDNHKELQSFAIHRYGTTSKLKNILELISIFWENLSIESKLKITKEEMKNKYLPTDIFTSSHQLYSVISQRIPLYSETSNLHTICSSVSSILNSFILTALTKIQGETNEKLFSDFSKLISNCENVESMDVPNALKNLANEIKENGAREIFLKMSPKEAVEWMEEEKGCVGIKYKEFLQQHGHRGLMEFDLLSLPWDLDPAQLVKSLQLILKDLTQETKDNKKRESPDAAVEQLRLPINRIQRYLLKKLVSWARNAVSKREKSKSILIKSVDIYRRAYRKLGELMENEGRIPDSNLIFFFTHEEIGVLLKNRSAHLISKALRRRKLHKNIYDLKFDEIVSGFPKPITEKMEYISKSSDWTINGIPIYHGIVVAPARVVQKFEEAENIQPGEILVTYSTDVGWTPYFPKLSGIVTELGGLLSHGAVVAREFGTPCIIGARGATVIVKTGDIVELNGKAGTLKKV
ncbi:rifampicin phosphotransferase-like [Centruroides vittatus]|uniref:rifampicin phosphotransferase-like n=1 Tax=Centruroides vittatus TaxID=120091 RepID=UPI00350F4C5F